MKKLAYLTDLHLDEAAPNGAVLSPRKNLETILADIRGRGIKKLIIGGDIGLQSAHEWFFALLKNDFPAYHISLGNHDVYGDVSKFLEPSISQSNTAHYYAAEQDHLKYIVLDSSSDEVPEAQLKWLGSEIDTAKDILLFIHHPILPVDTAVDRPYSLKNRDQIKELLQSIPNQITIFCGHYHCEDYQTDGNIRQVLTPAVSFQVRKHTQEIEIETSCFGYRIIGLDGAEITSETVIFNS